MVDTLSESGIAVGSTGLEFRGDDADCHGLAHSGYGGKFRLECSDAGRGRKREGRRVKCVNASRPVRLHALTAIQLMIDGDGEKTKNALFTARLKSPRRCAVHVDRVLKRSGDLSWRRDFF